MKTVVLGISGGVDSSVAAILLKQKGHNVLGLFMKNWEEDDEDGICSSDKDLEDAKAVCEKLGIPFYSVNFAKEYKENVFKYFKEEIANGRTPNPDVLCNKEIKFKPFLAYAKKLGADYIATGHYCKRIEKNGKVYLGKCKDENKDQTYFLNQLNEEQIKACLFPLGDIEKPKVREIAKEYGLVTAEKKDSTGICFIGERNFKNFLKNYFKTKEGVIKTTDGKTVGRHEGVQFYTIGQGKGLNIGGVSGYKEGKWTVVKKDIKTNELIIGQEDDPQLYSKAVKSNNFNFITESPKEKEFKAACKIRYRQAEQECTVIIHNPQSIINNGSNFNAQVEIIFKNPQRAATQGQFAVIYLGDICLGGGAIDEIY